MTRSEQWRHVVGFERFYAVSDRGRVRSFDRKVRAVSKAGNEYFRTVRGRLLATERDGDYVRVHLSDNATKLMARVHDLVLTAFMGPCPPGELCRHLDGSRNNNRLGNLRWGTHEENMADKRKHGTHLECERHPRALLDNVTARAIRSATGTNVKIAALYGCSPSTVSLIKNGRIWRAA